MLSLSILRLSIFNIWQPTTSRSFEVVQSKGLVDFGEFKNMNQFENADVDYALARIKNSDRLVSKKSRFSCTGILPKRTCLLVML